MLASLPIYVRSIVLRQCLSVANWSLLDKLCFKLLKYEKKNIIMLIIAVLISC